ncbi:MAG: DNA polymerase III subunit alpha [Candidatus Pelagibacter sp. TMED64]|nr:DNA polymerase III subunit alpha [Candidatus Pelagibacter sp.]OUU67972.1 MAG: DNA polymerase III subunit alpha [Candidatus Pelagibacter sp. TMED64]
MNEINKNQFSHLKVHTQYSICEGAIKISDLSLHAKLHKIKTLGVCDTSNLCGALEFSESISKSGTQPIIGTQINISYKNNIGKIPLYAMNFDGYKNLIKLSSKSFLDIKSDETPHCKLEDLLNNSNGLSVFTGTINGLFGKLFTKNLIKDIDEIIQLLQSSFKNNLYIEIQRHNDLGENEYEEFLLNISKKFNLPLIATHEVFYINKDMYEAHDAFLCIGLKSHVNDKNRKRYSNQHYLKDSKEMFELFSDLPEALENNINFPYRINFKPNNSSPILPEIFISETKSVDDELEKQALDGLTVKLNEFIIPLSEDKNNTKKIKDKYEDRLNHEINIIKKMKYSGYFLIVSDYIKWSKSNNIPVGPGRGSGAGSLVAWCLSITDVDPIKFDLIFERFLNPDRISMPDFDIDFCEEKREKVLNYLSKKYGKGVAHIITFGKLKARMALRDIGRVLGIPYGYIDSLCKMIPFDPSRPLSLQECINREPRLQEAAKKDFRVKKLFELSLKLEGLNRNIATHAAGVVIAEKNLAETIPLYKDLSSDLALPVTQFDMYSSENAGLIKFDLLGLKTLTVIHKNILTLKNNGIEIDIHKISLDDKKVFNLLSSGESLGLFQLESTGMRDALVKMKPNRFEDIIALVALFRPGPMKNIPVYNQCKHGEQEPDYLHPRLKKILEPTYGVIIYQEQVMQIAQTLSGFTAGEADILRKAMGKKKRAELEKQKERFVNGAVKNGITKETASFIFAKIEPFAEYGFNKSHAAAYAMIAYQTAYLKAYYPNEFIAASMTNELSNTDKLAEFNEELKRLKIKVIAPCINNCFAEFVSKDNSLYYALGAIKSVGFEAINSIVIEREKNGKFKSLNDFLNRVNPKNINKLQLEGLVKAGAFDCFNKNRKMLFDSIPNIILSTKAIHENRLNNQAALFKDDNKQIFEVNNLNNDKWEYEEKMSKEFESVGFYITDHPLNDYKEIMDIYHAQTYKEFIENNKDTMVLAGTVMKIQLKKTNKGNSFALVKFSDFSGVYELFLFSDIYELNREKLKEGKSFLITVSKDISSQDDRFKRINVRKIISISDIINKSYTDILIEIDNTENLPKLSELISEKGDSSIKISIKNKEKNYVFELKNKRKFDYKTLKSLKNEDFIRKINI